MSWDIVGQEQAVAVLRRAVEDEARLSHAYLFVGPEHVGRATTARRFAQALNCEAGTAPSGRDGLADESGGHPESPAETPAESSRPCGECRPCKLIADDKHPDVEWVGVGGLCEVSEHKDHSADKSRDIRICQIRRLERVVSLTPYEGRYRVLIIDPADALTVEAANAFLKTLEEPPDHVVLVLIASREETLRETVRSRCRRIAFSGVPRRSIEEALRERWEASEEQASRLARLAQGRLGWAVLALQDDKLLADRDQTIEDIEAVMAGGLSERFEYAAELGQRYTRSAESVFATLEHWRGWWRDVLLMAAGKDELVADIERLDTLRSHASQYGVTRAVQALTAIGDGRRHLEENASPTLALEAMLLELPLPANATGR